MLTAHHKIFVSIAMALCISGASAQRIDGIELGESNNLLLQRLVSNAAAPAWQDPQKDLQAVGKFGDGTFWVSDKSVRRNWQEHVIFKLIKLYDKNRFLNETDEQTKKRVRIAFTAAESVIELNCANKQYSVKGEAFYSPKTELIKAEIYKEEFVAFKAGSAIERLHQQYCL